MARQRIIATKIKTYKTILILYRIRSRRRFKNSGSNIYDITISNIGKN